MSEKALQIAEKTREAKGKGEKEKYTHMNTQFRRRRRRDKKAFLSDQCEKKKKKKKKQEKRRMGKTRDLVKKIRYTKGTFHERWTQ